MSDPGDRSSAPLRAAARPTEGGACDRTIASDAGGERDESYCSACGKSFAVELDNCPDDGARLTKLKARPDALVGRVFEQRYEVRTALGAGGMGVVYRGWQLSVDREVAIKVVHPKLATDRVAVKRFLREVRLSSRLSHPNIVNVYDFGQTDDGILYLVMELLRGHTLSRELAAEQPIAPRRVAAIALQLCDALDSAHGQGVIHRDLKPGNIVILDDPPGRDLIKVLDFGLAKSLIADTSSVVTHTSAILGTPLYMAPEQIDGKPTDPRSDLYALGCILYHAVRGRPPFLGDTVNSVLAAHLSEPPPALPSSVPASLARAIAQLMAKDPAKRIASAAATRAAILGSLEALAAGELSDTAPEVTKSGVTSEPLGLAMTDPAAARGAMSSVVRAPPSRRWLLALGALAIMAVVSVTVVLTLDRRDRARAIPHSIDAGIVVDSPMVIDAGMAPIVVDAPETAATPIDAAKKPKTKPRIKIDAGVDIDFVPSKR